MGILMGLADRVILVAAFVGGAAVPSFMAQYKQRIDAALAQAQTDLLPFQQVADQLFKGDIQAMAAHHLQSADLAVRGEGAVIRGLADSVTRLGSAATSLGADLYNQLLFMATRADPLILAATWDKFEPSIAFTTTTLAAGAAAGAAVWLAFLLLVQAVQLLTGLTSRPSVSAPSYARAARKAF